MTAYDSTKQQDEPTLFTLDQVADILQVKRRTVLTLIQRGDLRAIEVAARRLRVQAADLNAYLQARVVAPSAGGVGAVKAAIGDVDANTVARRRALRSVDPEALEHWLKSRRRGSWPTD